MPPNLIHCRTCRELLNPDLERNSIEVPEFIPLPELATIASVSVTGYYVNCPACAQELKISRKYLGEKVLCKFCQSGFRLDLTNPAFQEHYAHAPCPHCSESLRFAAKYLGMKVSCRYCSGKLHLLANDE